MRVVTTRQWFIQNNVWKVIKQEDEQLDVNEHPVHMSQEQNNFSLMHSDLLLYSFHANCTVGLFNNTQNSV